MSIEEIILTKLSEAITIVVDIVYQEDCIRGMKTLANESIDLIVTDPPYLMNYKTSYRKNKNHKFCNSIIGDNDPKLIHDYITECYRILKKDSALYMFCNANKVEVFKKELEIAGFNVKNMIIWVKNNHSAGDLKAQYGKKYEILFYANKGRCHIRGQRLTDVWEFPRVSGKELLHQNQKPVNLIRQCIEKSSDPGAIVFDGFMGSGTTAIACLETDRRYIGYELDSDYYKICQNRIANWKNIFFN